MRLVFFVFCYQNNSRASHQYWTNSTNPSLWVHGLVYDMEYGGIVDLNITMGAPGASAPPPTHFPKWSPSA